MTTRREELRERRLQLSGGGLLGLLDHEADGVSDPLPAEEEERSVSTSVAAGKKIASHTEIVYYELQEARFRLDLHRRRLLNRLESRGCNANLGGGLYAFPAMSPNKDVEKFIRHKKKMEAERRRAENEAKVKEEEARAREADDRAVSEQQRLFNEWARQQDGEGGGVGVGLDQALLMRERSAEADAGKATKKAVDEQKEEEEKVEIEVKEEEKVEIEVKEEGKDEGKEEEEKKQEMEAEEGQVVVADILTDLISKVEKERSSEEA